MVVVVGPPPALLPETVSLFYVVDELLARSPVLVFYGPSATPTATASNSRIQAHVFSPAGLQSNPRLTISPSSPLYSAIHCLPREEQGDDVCRGLAFSLCKYFAELSPVVKDAWETQPAVVGRMRSAPNLFSDSHAAMLASRMVKVGNVSEVIGDLRQALAEQSLSWLDLDIVLPPGSMKQLELGGRDSILPQPSDEDLATYRYGCYAPVVKFFGEPAFLPTSRLRRAPSKPVTPNRSANFSKKQKENLRREMCELLDTEENYVKKLNELVHSHVDGFRQKAQNKRPMSGSPNTEALNKLFPSSLDQILETNLGFLDALRKTIEDTENDAIQDIASTGDAGTNMPSVPTRTDVTGTLALATCMRHWFPKFAECYLDYTQAHSQFSSHLRAFMKDKNSSFSRRVQEAGEQQIMSLLIEPVQRLPRYNLYIDNLIKQLPARHPALNSLLKARDTISEICSADQTVAAPSRVLENLRLLISGWPQNFRPEGRLISAYDISELPPPYRKGTGVNSADNPRSMFGILVLFTDFAVVLRKSSKQSTTARSVLAQVDGTDIMSNQKPGDLTFRQALSLNSFDLTEMDSGRLLQLVPLPDVCREPKGPRRPGSSRPGSARPGSSTSESAVQVFQLGGAHEGKAARVVEDLVKARVEGRFSEAERESQSWEVRSASCADLTLFAALFEQSVGERPAGRGTPARIRVVVDPHKGTDVIKAGRHGVDIAVTLTVVGDNSYRLETEGMNDCCTRDQGLTGPEILPVLCTRLTSQLKMRMQIRNPALAAAFLQRNQHILQSINVVTEESQENTVKEFSNRPHSPVKMLSNLFGVSVAREHSTLRKHHALPKPSLAEIPQFHKPPISRPASHDGPVKVISHAQLTNLANDAPLKLEETLSGYILALQTRKGNIVGKILRSRASADVLAINELYNALLEEPNNYEIVAQAPIDILFCAFEKFLKVAWYDNIGPVISHATRDAILFELDRMRYPSDFEEFFLSKFAEMIPQNQRALRATVQLLGELLAGTANDGDRGALTASFAEVLTLDVTVLDRLVESQGLLETELPAPSTHGSLRKRFGLALSRKPSKMISSQPPPRKKRRSSISDLRSLQAEVGRSQSYVPVPMLSPPRRVGEVSSTSTPPRSRVSGIPVKSTPNTPSRVSPLPVLSERPSSGNVRRPLPTSGSPKKATSSTQIPSTSSIPQQSPTKALALEKLLRQAQLENEELYARFNDELEKIYKLKNVSMDAIKQWREAADQAAKLKHENGILRRQLAMRNKD